MMTLVSCASACEAAAEGEMAAATAAESSRRQHQWQDLEAHSGTVRVAVVAANVGSNAQSDTNARTKLLWVPGSQVGKLLLLPLLLFEAHLTVHSAYKAAARRTSDMQTQADGTYAW
jgi:hypothetical protein